MSRWREAVCWALIVGALVANAVIFYDTIAELHRLVQEVNAKSDLDLEGPPPEPSRVPVEILGVAGAAIAMIVAAQVSERWRRRVRVEEPQTRHGGLYLVGFTLAMVGTALGPICFSHATWWLPVLITVASFAVGLLFVAVRCGSIRLPLVEWGWRRGRGLFIELGIGGVAALAIFGIKHLLLDGGPLRRPSRDERARAPLTPGCC